MALKKILIVEDDDNIRNTLREVFEMEGYPVDVAENGQIALDRLRQAPSAADLPALILLDMMMPVMDGHAFLRERQRFTPPLSEIPVIVISAAKEALPTGVSVNAFLRKPLELNQVLDVAAQYCG